MKDTFEMEPTAFTNREHPGLSNPEDVNRLSETGYKRFRRRGQKAEQAAPVARAVPVPTPKAEQLRERPTPVAAIVEAEPQPEPTRAMVTGWDALRQVTPGVQSNEAGGTPLVSFNRDDPASKAFDQLRTRLLQTLRSEGWSRIAIASPTAGCGSTFTAVNLGLSMARIPGSRTVLMDLNLRTPGLAKALDVQSTGDMRGFLSGKISTSKHIVRVKETLALGLAGAPDRDAAELLHDRRAGLVLEQMQHDLSPDVILYDLPPILAYDDLAAFLPQVDGVLLVSDATRTVAADIEACERVLEGQTKVLGVILNQTRATH